MILSQMGGRTSSADECTPLPDNQWEVWVKKENHGMLRILLKHLTGTDNGNI